MVIEIPGQLVKRFIHRQTRSSTYWCVEQRTVFQRFFLTGGQTKKRATATSDGTSRSS